MFLYCKSSERGKPRVSRVIHDGALGFFKAMSRRKGQVHVVLSKYVVNILEEIIQIVLDHHPRLPTRI